MNDRKLITVEYLMLEPNWTKRTEMSIDRRIKVAFGMYDVAITRHGKRGSWSYMAHLVFNGSEVDLSDVLHRLDDAVITAYQMVVKHYQ